MALTTLSRLKSQLGINGSDLTQDSRLQFYIDAASQKIETYCDRKFNSQSFTDYFHGRKQNIIMPKQFPIISVTELRVQAERDWADATGLIAATDYFVSDSDNTIIYEGFFPNGFGNIRLIYTAGYATIPSDLELACVWLAEWFYYHKTKADMGRTSVSKGDENLGVLANMPPMIQEMLIDYKRTEMPAAYAPVGNL